MEFKKLNAPTLKELFVSELENMILSGKLEIGSRLPSERELAASMQVSRAVVNSGIAEMEAKGFLVVKPRIGTFVEDYRRNGSLSTLMSIMNYNGGMLRKNEIQSILEVRIVLDTLAVQLVCEYASTEAVASLEQYVEEMGKCKDAGRAAELAFTFHHELGFISGNTLLPLFFASFRNPVVNLWIRFCNHYGIAALYENTSTLYHFIQEKDSNGAIDFINQSIQESIQGPREIYL